VQDNLPMNTSPASFYYPARYVSHQLNIISQHSSVYQIHTVTSPVFSIRVGEDK